MGWAAAAGTGTTVCGLGGCGFGITAGFSEGVGGRGMAVVGGVGEVVGVGTTAGSTVKGLGTATGAGAVCGLTAGVFACTGSTGFALLASAGRSGLSRFIDTKLIASVHQVQQGKRAYRVIHGRSRGSGV